MCEYQKSKDNEGYITIKCDRTGTNSNHSYARPRIWGNSTSLRAEDKLPRIDARRHVFPLSRTTTNISTRRQTSPFFVVTLIFVSSSEDAKDARYRYQLFDDAVP